MNLYLQGVVERGVPNRERIVISVGADVDTTLYVLMLGISRGPDLAVPVRDNVFWPGKLQLKKGDWVFVYTGGGEFSVNRIPNGENSLYSLYWNRDETVFHDPNIVPMLVEIAEVSIDHYKPSPLPAVPGKPLKMNGQRAVR